MIWITTSGALTLVIFVSLELFARWRCQRIGHCWGSDPSKPGLICLRCGFAAGGDQ